MLIQERSIDHVLERTRELAAVLKCGEIRWIEGETVMFEFDFPDDALPSLP